VSAAIEIGRQFGSLNAVTMRLVANASRLSATDIYDCFASKAEIIREARNDALADFRDRLRLATLAPDSEDAVVEWVESYLAGDASDPWLRDVFPVGGPTTPEFAEAAEVVEFAALRRCIGALGATPRVLDHSSWLSAWTLWGATHALLVGQRFAPHAVSDELPEGTGVGRWLVERMLPHRTITPAPMAEPAAAP
jgi:AcrR family transcriptional regulator